MLHIELDLHTTNKAATIVVMDLLDTKCILAFIDGKQMHKMIVIEKIGARCRGC